MRDHGTAAVRAYTPRRSSRPRRDREPQRPAAILVLDAETAPTLGQGLLFLSYRLCRATWDGWSPTLRCVEEGLVHADDLAATDPAGFAILEVYCRTHAPAVDPSVLDATYRLVLRDRSGFVDDVLYPAALLPGGPRAWIATFGAAWDLSRLIAPHLAVSPSGWEARAGYEPVTGAATDPAGPKRRGRTTKSKFAGGFSLPMWEFRDASGVWRERRPYRPRLAIKHLGTRKNLYGWVGARADRAATDGPAGRVLDLLTFSAAMTGESQDLESACRAHGFEYQEELDRLGIAATKRTIEHGRITLTYVGYNRADTAATTRLTEAALREYGALGCEMPPPLVLSAASLAKDTLDRLGVRPLLDRQPDVDPGVMGLAMAALFGGRTETRIRRLPLPVRVTDLVSEYPTVSILMRLQEYLTCASVEVVEEDPAALEAWIDGLTLDDVLDPATWPRLRVIALVDPRSDVLPVRYDWHDDGTLGIGVNIIRSACRPLPYALPDVVGSKLATGRAPHIVRALRFVPVGGAAGLRPVSFGARVRIDLERDDLYRTLIEERVRVKNDRGIPDGERRRIDLGTKVVANSLYGITAEVRPATLPAGSTSIDVNGLDAFRASPHEPEEPGRFFFAPQAALTTAGGRLLLMLIEQLVTDAGGSWVFADTDSCAIVASERGGPVDCPAPDGSDVVRALSYEEVDRLVRVPINRLNPYDRTVVPDLLKVEKVNFEDDDPTHRPRDLRAYAVAAKKYALVVPRPGATLEIVDMVTGAEVDQDERGPAIVDRREHGLGYLRNPIDPAHDPDGRDWVTAAWAHLLALDAGEQPAEPDWFTRPQMSRNATISTPAQLRAFARWNRGKPTTEAMKPFNFLNRVFVDEQEIPARLRGLTLAAPYDTDPRRWLSDTYVDIADPAGRTYRITTARLDPDTGDDGSGRIVVRSYGDLVHGLPRHPESKSLGPDGRVCGAQTKGLLARRTIDVTDVIHVKKESTQLAGDGLEGVRSRVAVFEEVSADAWERTVRPLLLTLPTAEIARVLGVDRATVKRWKSDSQRPRGSTLARLRAWLEARAGR